MALPFSKAQQESHQLAVSNFASQKMDNQFDKTFSVMGDRLGKTKQMLEGTLKKKIRNQLRLMSQGNQRMSRAQKEMCEDMLQNTDRKVIDNVEQARRSLLRQIQCQSEQEDDMAVD